VGIEGSEASPEFPLGATTRPVAAAHSSDASGRMGLSVVKLREFSAWPGRGCPNRTKLRA